MDKARPPLLRIYLTIALACLLIGSVGQARPKKKKKIDHANLCSLLVVAMEQHGLDSLYKAGKESSRAAVPDLNLPEGTQVYRLGNGHAGTVFRILPPGESPFIYKIYDQPSGPHDYEEDFTVLRVLAGLEVLPDPIRFRYLDAPIKGPGRSLILPDSRGWPLNEVLQKWPLDQKSKEALVYIYNERQWQLVEDLERQYDLEEKIFPGDKKKPGRTRLSRYEHPGLRKGKSKLLFTLELSESNVLVNLSSLNMPVFDPK